MARSIAEACTGNKCEAAWKNGAGMAEKVKPTHVRACRHILVLFAVLLRASSIFAIP